MLHKGFVIATAAIGIFVVCKVTNLGSYAGTLWSQARSEAKRHVSTKFEIQRVRHEVAQLDKDIAGMIRPIAEYKAALQQLDKDLQQNQTKLADRREALLRLTRDLETHPVSLVIGGKQVPYERAKNALDRDFDGFQRLEKHVDSLTKLQTAKQQSLDAATEQLAKVVAKKREFVLRLAQLETDEETLQMAGVGNKMAVDDNRASAIEAALQEIEQRHSVRRAELDMATGDLINEALSPARPKVDLATMRAHLEGHKD